MIEVTEYAGIGAWDQSKMTDHSKITNTISEILYNELNDCRNTERCQASYKKRFEEYTREMKEKYKLAQINIDVTSDDIKLGSGAFGILKVQRGGRAEP